MMTSRKYYRAMSGALTAVVLLGVATISNYSSKINEANARITELNEEIDKQNSRIENAEVLISEKDKQIHELSTSNQDLSTQLEEAKSKRIVVSRGESRESILAGTGEVFEATAYTLGGNTAIGYSLSGQSWDSARVIAVDPSVIPLGSQVYVEFDGDWSAYNGIYTAADTGGAINGNIIDVFVGHGEDSLARSFGRRSVRITQL